MTAVLDHGYADLYDSMGNDLRIVNMARQSFGKDASVMGMGERGLIKFLMRERHGTPFEGVVFHFNIKCPIFVAREWMRHRIGSYSEYSGRYTKMLSDFYMPELDQIRTQTGKVGAYKFEPAPNDVALLACIDLAHTASYCWDAYERALDAGIAKEVARMHLPVNIYTQFSWVVNLRSLFNFISLRSAENAMWEIRQYSQALETHVEYVVPVAWKAFEASGRLVP